MVDKERIIIMTKLASYDKNKSEEDSQVLGYFRHDYVYRKNVVDRFFVLLGGIILLAVDYLRRIFMEYLDVFSLDFGRELRGILVFLGILLVVYTIIGSVKHNYEYTKCQLRMKKYRVYTKRLYKDSVKPKPRGIKTNDV